MPPEKTQQYTIPPVIEQLAQAAGINAQMLKETRDFLADALNRNQHLTLENASLKQDNVKLRQKLESAEDALEACTCATAVTK